MRRSRWIIPVGFFLALAGGGLATSVTRLGRSDELTTLMLQADVAPDRTPGEAGGRGGELRAAESRSQARAVPVLRFLRFAVLRAQSPPHGF